MKEIEPTRHVPHAVPQPSRDSSRRGVLAAFAGLLTIMAFGSKATASGGCADYCQAKFRFNCYGPGVYLGGFFDPNDSCGYGSGSADTSLSGYGFGLVNFSGSGYTISAGCMGYGGCGIFTC